MRPLKIGISGIRGIVGDAFTPELVVEFAQAFGTWIDGGRVLVCCDTRPSGPMVHAAVVSGLLASGCEVIDLGIAPTPSLQLAVPCLEAAGGVSVTVFWSKNYRPLLDKLEAGGGTTRNLFFHFTITANREFELHAPDHRETIRDFVFLARRYSPRHVIWRYDPVCITDKRSFETHEERFVRCADRLKGSAERCIITFVHAYKKTTNNFRKYSDHTMQEPPRELQQEYARRLAGRAGSYGISLYACCNDHLLSESIHKASCIDGPYLSRLFNRPVDTRAAASRTECGCTKSVDIGACRGRYGNTSPCGQTRESFQGFTFGGSDG